MSEHTPGPWEFDGDWLRIPTVFGAGRQMVAHVEKHKRMATNPGPQEDLAEREANARLIAAAPDLLRAAKTLLLNYGAALAIAGQKDQRSMEMARAAIAKAEA